MLQDFFKNLYCNFLLNFNSEKLSLKLASKDSPG